jgi:aerobic-type carbon monoxide dehydrogenase small subunit (CoxS/CutS family)
MSTRTLRTPVDPPRAIDADDEAPLLDVLRRELRVRSAARGCQDGSCGSCRVLVNGALVSSCRLPWGDVPDGALVEAYESLAGERAVVRAVDAFEAERPTRCKMCVGALGVTAAALARATPERPLTLEDALADATCMCTGRGSWRRALTR